MLIMYMY